MNINKFYKNNKNGNIYYAERTGIDCTNKDCGLIKVVYYLFVKDSVDFDAVYFREIGEFYEKFTEIGLDDIE